MRDVVHRWPGRSAALPSVAKASELPPHLRPDEAASFGGGCPPTGRCDAEAAVRLALSRPKARRRPRWRKPGAGPLVLAALIFFALVQPVAGEELTAAQWFAIAVELQGQPALLDAEERAFVRSMVNVLALSEDAVPKLHQQTWLLHIKERVDEARKRERGG